MIDKLHVLSLVCLLACLFVFVRVGDCFIQIIFLIALFVTSKRLSIGDHLPTILFNFVNF